MSNGRPNFIDLRSQSQMSVSRPLKSPRLHVAGEVPPELSPLDAFALQSRLLARQLQESANSDKRLSRLPPLTTESPLVVQGRSDYFRSMSQDSDPDNEGELPPLQPPPGLGLRTEVEENPNRPQSMHPRMSRVPPTPDEPMPSFNHAALDDIRGRQLDKHDEEGSYFGARQDRSPSPMGSYSSHREPSPSAQPAEPIPQRSPLRNRSPLRSNTAPSPEKLKKNPFDTNMGLVPPRSLFPKRSSSIMSSPIEGTDEDNASSMTNSFYSQGPRKLSASSSLASPAHPSFQRSPSMCSDMSAPLPRPSFNFSRPLSRAGTPSFDMPARQASSDSQASFVLADESATTPISMHSEGFPDNSTDDGRGGAPSYIYSKFTLPRGKALQRSGEFSDSQVPGASPWDQNTGQTLPQGGQAPPSPPTRPSSSAGPIPRPSLERSKLSTEILSSSGPTPSLSGRPSNDLGRESEDAPRGRALKSPLHEVTRADNETVGTSDTASTIKPKSQHTLASAADIPAEEHVEKAIQLHENGSLNESTYHLRHAARQGHPTGMLLYALACRHGWGMRPNQREGVQWLRKAAECAGLEIADDEDQMKEGRRVDFLENKTHKAQFALSIYELGVSHMNGWGIEQDKALALRCFEIAGSWGDVDALAEAGFCYAQGVGCKKNLKKSAKFYRQAEAKGMSMVGNSWIHKSKYNDEGKDGKKKNRSKSRSRGIFGKKSS
ncbi:uncharacterized protein E0L32_003631 [Thyridium curvatum]|uniref:Uncharacterized protein n=1 Tax=Thyridium curvatum TaxID=1093900 RepID=A0A507BJC3_9PEZI|nr:uncharacterized protein E0L32_003631 [Thyridium curvatum]TPX16690.1 hypothetical protein E0L32_003631 [Thyridium curvatum]